MKKTLLKSYILITTAIIFGSVQASFAKGSGYYEVPIPGKAVSPNMLCCCKKENKISNQSFYSCKHIESEDCPRETQHYNVSLKHCPNSLIVTKYKN